MKKIVRPKGVCKPRRKFVNSGRIVGSLSTWKRRYGWITPMSPIDHPAAHKNNGKVYVSSNDVAAGHELSRGTRVSFGVYVDSKGLGALSVRLDESNEVFSVKRRPAKTLGNICDGNCNMTPPWRLPQQETSQLQKNFLGIQRRLAGVQARTATKTSRIYLQDVGETKPSTNKTSKRDRKDRRDIKKGDEDTLCKVARKMSRKSRKLCKMAPTCGPNQSFSASRDDLREALCMHCGLSPDDFEPEYDVEYSSNASRAHKKRGPEPYYLPPAGSMKFALRVVGQYENDEWLSKQGGWPVVYHGTSAIQDVVSGIVHDGFKIRGGLRQPRHGEKHGEGIYCAPLYRRALRYAEVPLNVLGNLYTLLFQCRVREHQYEKIEEEVWVVRNESDIRPCGIVLIKFPLPGHQCIEYKHENPYEEDTVKWQKYERCKSARTVVDAIALGRDVNTLLKDFDSGRLTLVVG